MGRFCESSSIWSVVKPVFIQVQQRKCAYCERQFETIEYGAIEYDLEHFRPKSPVRRWPPGNWPRAFSFPTGDETGNGYYWLAYSLSNYLVSCKVCNSVLKSNYFPVAGNRITRRCNVARLRAELPYLCYPIGEADENPEKLVTFIATTAVPAAKSGHRRRRGEIIIDFFQLNARLQLHVERAKMIALVGCTLAAGTNLISARERGQAIARFSRNDIPHAACVRAFLRVWRRDKSMAQRILRSCLSVATSSSGLPEHGAVGNVFKTTTRFVG
jgi:hypothetical protein